MFNEAFNVTLKLTHGMIESGRPKILKLNKIYEGQIKKLGFLQNRK